MPERSSINRPWQIGGKIIEGTSLIAMGDALIIDGLAAAGSAGCSRTVISDTSF